MPFPIYSSPIIPYTCGSEAAFPTNESPNGNTDADVEISPLSHEISEAMTDPDTSTGWYDSSGFENGDECAYEYGAASGQTGALYNQTLNGHHYLTQEEFSNNDYNQGRGGCLQSYAPAAKPGVTSLSSHSGRKGGGTSVTITGTTLGGADAVYFGTTRAVFTVVDPTHIQATAPKHARGTVDVTVHNSLGTSPATAADRYTYS
jgi:IPT/TIG domain